MMAEPLKIQAPEISQNTSYLSTIIQVFTEQYLGIYLRGVEMLWEGVLVQPKEYQTCL